MSQWSVNCHLINEMSFVGDDQIQEGRLLARVVSVVAFTNLTFPMPPLLAVQCKIVNVGQVVKVPPFFWCDRLGRPGSIPALLPSSDGMVIRSKVVNIPTRDSPSSKNAKCKLSESGALLYRAVKLRTWLQLSMVDSSWLYVGLDTARAPTPRQEDDWGPHPKLLAQKPGRKAAVFVRKCKYTTAFTEQVAAHTPHTNLEDQETVRQTSNDWPSWYGRLCECHTDTSQYSSIDLGGTQTITQRLINPSAVLIGIVFTCFPIALLLLSDIIPEHAANPKFAVPVGLVGAAALIYFMRDLLSFIAVVLLPSLTALSVNSNQGVMHYATPHVNHATICGTIRNKNRELDSSTTDVQPLGRLQVILWYLLLGTYLIQLGTARQMTM
ncbi:hypothetical protein CLF_102487 [Clonorchis sinensis]|uniref:Uncharacterized protein n=1 Tax=Clonorchis sinensis TaxID=79923 RepID=G7Y816_CLOSI|nr:hypothetical protein CLF_102487 [Clonorchis sinensis]